MKLTMSRKLHYYYFISLATFLFLSSVGLYYFWQSGIIRADSISGLFEASLKIDEVKQKNYYEIIWKDLNSDNVSAAFKNLELMEKKIKSVNEDMPNSARYNELLESFKKNRDSMNAMLNVSDLTSVLNVLKSKILGFYNYVENRDWKNLTRISKKMLERIIPDSGKDSIVADYDRIINLKRSIIEDVRIMRNLVEGSVLSRQDKDLVLIKLQTLKTETDAFDQYLKLLDNSSKDLTNLKTIYEAWISSIAPEISFRKIKHERDYQFLIFSFIGGIVFLFLVLIFGGVIFGETNKKNIEELESSILDAVKNGILPQENKFLLQLSDDFQKEFQGLKDYVHNRMYFGVIFQEALPFPAVLLDSNLNVIWGNTMLYEAWEMEDYKEKNLSLSWDFLRRFTNLGEDDPVIVAMNTKIAGIYNIQLRPDNNSTSTPYEMYVSPVEYMGNLRIMIFFYPLRSLEDTITGHTASIVGPVGKVLDALTEHYFDKEFKERIKNDFEIAGINELYEKFIKHSDVIKQQKNGLMSEIDRLENDLVDKHKIEMDLRHVFQEQHQIYKNMITKFNNAKQSITSIIDLRSETEAMLKKILEASAKSGKAEVELLCNAEKMKNAYEDNLKAFTTVGIIRSDLKNLKDEMQEFKNRMFEVLGQALMFETVEGSSSDRHKMLQRIKLETKGLDSLLDRFNTSVTALDVSLGKVDLLIREHKTTDFSQIKQILVVLKNTITEVSNMSSELATHGLDSDEKAVEQLKSLVGSIKENRAKTLEAEFLLGADSMNKESKQISAVDPQNEVMG